MSDAGRRWKGLDTGSVETEGDAVAFLEINKDWIRATRPRRILTESRRGSRDGQHQSRDT
ncbi:hypothetical protein ABZ599_39780 [Streptomyces misionensis]|uniref:hypothetical protein n=1 Tax=Streptomyces misionensis TaxID=67331 RepID=UPI0033E6D337